MKQSYTFGEFILALREKRKEVEPLLQELKNYISIDSEYKDFYFYAHLIDERVSLYDNCDLSKSDNALQKLRLNNRVRLFVEKECSEIKKKYYYLRYSLLGSNIYSISYIVAKNEDNTYSFEPSDFLVIYNPKVTITDQKKFNETMDKIMDTDYMKLHEKSFGINEDSIVLSGNHISIFTPLLGYDPSGYLGWDANDDLIDYSVLTKSKQYNYLTEKALELKIPSNMISSDWLKALEDNELKNGLVFDIEDNLKWKNGSLKISEIEEKNERGYVRLLKK